MTPFEYEDYRKKGPPPTWTQWTPDTLRYCMTQIFLLFVLPFLLGFALTPFGLLCNVILVDYILYRHTINNWKE